MAEHCLIVFNTYKDNNRLFLEYADEIKIVDEVVLEKIKNLGYLRNDMQSLFETKEFSYLTTDSIHYKELTENSSERDLQAFNLVKEIAKSIKFEIKDSFDCVDFSFPKFMYDDVYNAPSFNNFNQIETS